MANILIIDDDKSLCQMLHRKISYLDHHARLAHTLAEGLQCAADFAFDVILLDVRLPDGSGLTALPKFKAFPSEPEVIIITGEGDADGAELAIKAGAWDYIEKPIPMGDLKLQLARALQYRQERDSGTKPVALKRDNLIGISSQISACLDLVAQCAGSRTNVLIAGETGTGKELFAKAIHENSDCSGNSFVVVDCASLPEQLTESMLFGHVKGAFTGADRSQDGLIRLAHDGTLFLDEVGELSLTIQKRFLRVLQERRFRPVGSTKEISSDFRLISATNRNLDNMVKVGRFRKDLLFRLRTVSINLPPLRDRKEDIKGLLMHHISNLCKYHGLETKGFAPEFLEALEVYDWPGNVRELVNTLEKALLAAANSPIMYPMHLPDTLRIKYFQSSKGRQSSALKQQPPNTRQETLAASPFKTLPTLKRYREWLIQQGESEYIKQLMQASQNDISRACEISALGKSQLYALIKKHNIPRDKS